MATQEDPVAEVTPADPPLVVAIEPVVPEPAEPQKPTEEPQQEPDQIGPVEPEPVEAENQQTIWTVDELISFYLKHGSGSRQVMAQSQLLHGRVLILTGRLSAVSWRGAELAPLCERTLEKYGLCPSQVIMVHFGEVEVPGLEPLTPEYIEALKEQIGEITTFTGLYGSLSIHVPVVTP